jgi:ubiquinone/menaquinone biosynthesis C-methylase UbiE
MSGWMELADFQAAVRGQNDHDWHKLLLDSVENNVINNIVMPSFPPDEMQIGIHGHSGKTSLGEAIKYYNEVVKYTLFADHKIREDRVLLDFGTGWGRILRPWMRDIAPQNIYGADPHPVRIVAARSCNPYVNFFCSDRLPPLVLRDNSVDYIVAFSVFSHLDEFATRKWFAEFTRVLKPGGLIAVTTQRRAFIDTCAEVRKQKQGGKALTHPWQEALAKSFVDTEAFKQAYADGEFLYSATAGQVPNLSARYGESIIPPKFVLQHLCKGLDFIDFVDNAERLAQAIIVLQKPRS